jgi:hypothetical protein
MIPELEQTQRLCFDHSMRTILNRQLAVIVINTEHLANLLSPLCIMWLNDLYVTAQAATFREAKENFSPVNSYASRKFLCFPKA